MRLRLGSPRRGDGVLGGSLRAMLGVGLAGPSGPGASSRLSARAFRGSGGPARTAGGTSRGLLGSGGPLARPRRRSRAFRGGPSALTAAGRGKAGRTASLRLRRRRGDGVLGGGVLGSRSAGSMGALGGGRARCRVPPSAPAVRRARPGRCGTAAAPEPSQVPEQRPRPAALGRPAAARPPGIPCAGRRFPGGALAGGRGGPGAAARLRPAARLWRGPARRIPVAGAVA